MSGTWLKGLCVSGAMTAALMAVAPAPAAADEPDAAASSGRFIHLVYREIIKKVAAENTTRMIDHQAALNRRNCRTEGVGTYTVRKPPQYGTITTRVVYGQDKYCPGVVFKYTGLFYTPTGPAGTIDRFVLKWENRIPGFLDVTNAYYRIAIVK